MRTGTVPPIVDSQPSQAEPGKAHWGGPSDTLLLEETLGDWLEYAVKKWPDKIAVKTSDGAWNLQQLNQQSETMARGLLHLGLSKGDRLAIRLGNCVEYVLMLLACARLGVITVVLNSACSSEQTIAAITHVTAKCLLTSTSLVLPYKEARSDHSFLEAMANAAPSMPWLENVLYTGEVHHNKPPDNHGLPMIHLESVLRTAHEQEMGPAFPSTFTEQVLAHDILNIQFTSGTTSSPKAVSLTHRSVLNNARHIGQRMNLSASDVVCCPFPLFHCSGLVVGLLASLLNGSTVIFPSESFHPQKLLRAIKEEWPTVLHGVPTMFDAVIDLLGERNDLQAQVSRLRTGLIGGSFLTSGMLSRIRKHLHLPGLISAYGMTELSPLATSTCQSDSVDIHLNTVGRVVPHCSIRVTAPDDPRRTLATGERGEILVGGYLIMHGYWNDTARTDQVIIRQSANGNSGVTEWLRTGDQGMIDEHGYVKITGRIKDIIIRGGENIYPDEVEQCLAKLPHIATAVVVGIPDERLGEVLAAFLQVVPDVPVDSAGCNCSADLRGERAACDCDDSGPYKNPSASQVVTPSLMRQHVRQHLSAHQVPKYIFWASEMPLTPNGKIERSALRQLGIRAIKQHSLG